MNYFDLMYEQNSLKAYACHLNYERIRVQYATFSYQVKTHRHVQDSNAQSDFFKGPGQVQSRRL